jgi:hypothetical protein
MANREAALRSIFEAIGDSARFNEDQKRELLGHLDDAVEAKIAAGVPEMEAVAQAFTEFGDLKRIAKEFPAVAPVVATAGAPAVQAWGSAGFGRVGYAHLLFFTFAQLLIVPSISGVALRLHRTLPNLTLAFLTFSEEMRRYWPAVLLGMGVLGAAQFLLRRPGKWMCALDVILGLLGTLLLAGVFVGVLLPFVTVLEGLQRR